MSDPIKKIVQEIDQAPPRVKPHKVTRSLSLENGNFVKLQRYCKRKNMPVGEVIDKLIVAFLDSLPVQESGQPGP